jgi:hypothetical protein
MAFGSSMPLEGGGMPHQAAHDHDQVVKHGVQIGGLAGRVDRIESKLDRLFYGLLAVMATCIVQLLVTLLKH